MVVTFLTAAVVNQIVVHRVRRRQESLGLDLSQHGETPYDFDPVDGEVAPEQGTTTAAR